METTHQNTDLFNEQTGKLPGMLNVLTILTLVGCAIAYISGIWNFMQSSNLEKQKEEFEKLGDRMGDSEMGSKMMEGSMEMLEKSHDYRYIILVATLLFTTMCLIGALQMRKLKKSGYTLYVIGEIAPIILTFAVFGFSLITGIGAAVGALIAIIFVILYTTQRKYLTRP